MVAFYFPPARGSGVQRTLSFCRDLPDFGWQPEVLSANPRVFPAIDQAQLNDLPPNLNVKYPFALDSAKDLAIAGRYLRSTATPDRWISWKLWAVPTGMSMIKEQKPNIIWATYPIATAMAIAYSLHKKTGIPWIADFRDPMAYDAQPDNPEMIAKIDKLEKKWVESCAKVIVTTPGHRKILQNKYPHIDNNRWAVIPNGYDETISTEVERAVTNNINKSQPENTNKITLLHSGTIYTEPHERDPRPLFAVLENLKKTQQISSQNLQIILRATGHDSQIQQMIENADITDLVKIKPALPYRAALEEMFSVDGLLLLQGTAYKNQVPAKLFEYLRAKRPLLALTDLQGDTARIMQEAEVTTIAPLNDINQIEFQLLRTINSIKTQSLLIASHPHLTTLSRHARAKELADILDGIE